MAMQCLDNLYIYHSKAVSKAILYPFPPEMGVELLMPIQQYRYEMCKLCMTINVHTLQYLSTKLGSLANFDVPFPTVEMDFPFFACIQILRLLNRAIEPVKP